MALMTKRFCAVRVPIRIGWKTGSSRFMGSSLCRTAAEGEGRRAPGPGHTRRSPVLRQGGAGVLQLPEQRLQAARAPPTAELPPDVGAVEVHRPGGDVEVLGDLLARPALL